MATAALAHSDSALLDSLRSIKWPARRLAPMGMPGPHLARILGVSAEFTEYRSYRPGDETRRIDWKLLARSNRAYIRLSNDRTVVPTIILLDASASLAYPADSLEKWTYARAIAVGLAAAAHRSGDPVGIAIATPDGVKRLPPRTRRSVIYEILHTVDMVSPAGSPLLAPIIPALRKAGRIAIISDFLGDTENLIKQAGQLAAARKEIHAVHIVHTHEAEPPRTTSLLTDPEDPSLKRPLTNDTRRRYLETFGDWRTKIARDWRMVGAYYTEVITNEPVPHAVRRVAQPRAD